MISETTQLVTIDNFDINNVIISEPRDETAGKSGAIKFKRAHYSYRNSDGSVGDLVILHDKLFSFGVNESIDQNNGALTGYSVGISLYDAQSGPTARQSKFIDIMEQLTELTATYLVENRVAIKKPKLERAELKKLSPISWRLDDETGEVLQDKAPSMFLKLLYSKKYERIYSKFFDRQGKELDPLDLVKKYFHITPAIKIESLYISRGMSMQIKLYECLAEMRQTEHKSLLSGIIAAAAAEDKEDRAESIMDHM